MQQARDDWRDRRREQRVQSGSRSRIAASVSEIVSPREGRAAREHLVEHAAERPDVGPLVDRLSARLLGAHVGRGPEDDAFARAADRDRRRLRQVRCRVVAGDRFREPEVEHLDHAVRRDLDVRRFQIAVNDALSRGRRRARRRSVARSSARRRAEAARARCVGERLALDQFQHERADAIGSSRP